MVADFGGGKTPGYFISTEEESATREDDIYAFAKTMDRLILAFQQTGGMKRTSVIYVEALCEGVGELLNREYGRDLRQALNFSSLYNGYAEALEVVLFHCNLDCAAEDVLPRRPEGIRADIVDTLNTCIRNMAMIAIKITI